MRLINSIAYYFLLVNYKCDMILDNIEDLIEESTVSKIAKPFVNAGILTTTAYASSAIGFGIYASLLYSIAPLFVAGGISYAIYRHLTSISRYKARIRECQNEIRQTSNYNAKNDLEIRLSKLKSKLEASKARAREENKKIIGDIQKKMVKVKAMESGYVELTKDEINDLRKYKSEIEARRKLLFKIGVIL